MVLAPTPLALAISHKCERAGVWAAFAAALCERDQMAAQGRRHVMGWLDTIAPRPWVWPDTTSPFWRERTGPPALIASCLSAEHQRPHVTRCLRNSSGLRKPRGGLANQRPCVAVHVAVALAKSLAPVLRRPSSSPAQPGAPSLFTTLL